MSGPTPDSRQQAAEHLAPYAGLLCCPDCSAILRPDEEGVICTDCKRLWAVREGVLDLRTLARRADSTSPQEDLPNIHSASPEGWIEAVRCFLDGRNDALRMLDALVAGRHQVWRGFLGLAPGSRLLCLGSGYGALAEGLAPSCRQLFILEPNISRLHFVRQRLAIFNAKDEVVLLAGDAGRRLPFSTGSFDGVIVAEPEVCARPAELLAEIRRVLRDQGQLLLLTDNRFSLYLPEGWWDTWAQLPWPLPGLARACGLLVRWWRRDNGPQSYATLRHRMDSVGFSEMSAFGLWPSRLQFDEIVSLAARRPTGAEAELLPWKQRLKRRAAFATAYCLTAQAGGDRRASTYERIFTAVARDLYQDRTHETLQPQRFILTRKDKMIVQAKHGNSALVIRIPFSEPAAAAEERHAAALARLALSHVGLAPRPLTEGRLDGFTYRAETAVPGVPLRKALRRLGSNDVLKWVGDLLDRLNPPGSLCDKPLEGDDYERLVSARLERICPLIRESGLRERLRAFFETELYGARLPFGLTHGDFSASNIYLSDGRAAIVDWEATDFDDLPILDAIGFIESVLRPQSPSHSLAEGFHAMAELRFPEVAEKQFLFARYKLLGIETRRHRGLVYLRWLRQIDYLLPYWLNYDPDGQQRYIHNVISLLLQGYRAR